MPHAARAAPTFAAALLCTATCQRFPTGRIEGTVRDRSGAPIANVSVGVLGLAPSGQSEASGRYRLHRPVPVGTHRLRATVAGYAPQERDSVVVRRGATTVVDFTLDPMWPGLVLPSTPTAPALRAADERQPVGVSGSGAANSLHQQSRRPHHLVDVRERDFSLGLCPLPHNNGKRGSLPAGLYHGADRPVEKA